MKHAHLNSNNYDLVFQKKNGSPPNSLVLPPYAESIAQIMARSATPTPCHRTAWIVQWLICRWWGCWMQWSWWLGWTNLGLLQIVVNIIHYIMFEWIGCNSVGCLTMLNSSFQTTTISGHEFVSAISSYS